MKSYSKKLLSLLLVLMMVAVILPAGQIAASAIDAWVQYDANGGTGSMPDQGYVAGVPVALSDCTFSGPYGYEFDGWNTADDGSGMSFIDEEVVTDLVSIFDSKVIKLYAKWKLKPVTTESQPQSESQPESQPQSESSPSTTAEPATTKALPVTTTGTSIPQTGSLVSGIAVFATLSLAAAAAFIARKKKDD